MKQPKEVQVFSVHVSYPYYDTEDMAMRETSLQRNFVADTYGEALDVASKWADNRLEAVIKDMYGQDAKVGCIKVGVRVIGRAEDSGFIPGGMGQFFEWKYDWPGFRNQHIESWKNSNAEMRDKHPSDFYTGEESQR